MAEIHDLNGISEKLEEQFKIFKWQKNGDGAFEIELPVVLYFNYQRLCLTVTPMRDGYFISDDGQTFFEHSQGAEYYLDLFEKNDQAFHYGIALQNGLICKQYDSDFALAAAIDEFIRFFILLDIFMQKNNLV
jgi:hypothetical protein